MPMDPELKAKWVAALRSGEYKQGRDVLHNNKSNTYCCLGVLCRVAEFETVGFSDSATVFSIPGFTPSSTSIPVEFFGIDPNNSKINPVDKVIDFNDRSDSAHRGFKGIATYIEKHF